MDINCVLKKKLLNVFEYPYVGIGDKENIITFAAENGEKKFYIRDNDKKGCYMFVSAFCCLFCQC